jgi:hypothetical protein
MMAEPGARGFACKRVWEQGEPVLRVCHELDGDWQFLCGGVEHTSSDEAVLIHPRHMFELHSSLRDVADLAPGLYAWRASATEPWKTCKQLDDK